MFYVCVFRYPCLEDNIDLFACVFRKVYEIEAREEDEEKIPVDLNKSLSWTMIHGLWSKFKNIKKKRKTYIYGFCLLLWNIPVQKNQVEVLLSGCSWNIIWGGKSWIYEFFCSALQWDHIEGGNHRFLINIMMESMQNNFLFVIFMWKVCFSEFYFCELKLKLLQELRKLPNPMSLKYGRVIVNVEIVVLCKNVFQMSHFLRIALWVCSLNIFVYVGQVFSPHWSLRCLKGEEVSQSA